VIGCEDRLRNDPYRPTVSGGALNSTQSNPIRLLSAFSLLAPLKSFDILALYKFDDDDDDDYYYYYYYNVTVDAPMHLYLPRKPQHKIHKKEPMPHKTLTATT